jgi:hypothetical protein
MPIESALINNSYRGHPNSDLDLLIASTDDERNHGDQPTNDDWRAHVGTQGEISS